jgi:AAA ATPase domain
VAVLLERTEELRALSAALDEARDGVGTTVLVGGEAGSGKSSLAAHFVATAPCRVLRSGCDGATTAAPLGPLMDIAATLGVDVRAYAGEPIDRVHLFAAVRAALGTEPTVWLVEDVHWADAATLELIRYLARRGDGSPTLQLLTFRDDEVGADHPLRVLLGELATVRQVRRIAVRPLSRAAVAELARGSHVELARALGDVDTEVHALNNVGTALMIAGDERGEAILQANLDTALAHDLQEHFGRAYTNLGATLVKHRRYAAGEDVLRAGIAFCADRDLDSWTSYMRGTLSILLLDTGRWAEARSLAHTAAAQSVETVSSVNALMVLGRLGTRTGTDPEAAPRHGGWPSRRASRSGC